LREEVQFALNEARLRAPHSLGRGDTQEMRVVAAGRAPPSDLGAYAASIR
jgi:hypothetical protein